MFRPGLRLYLAWNPMQVFEAVCYSAYILFSLLLLQRCDQRVTLKPLHRIQRCLALIHGELTP